MKRITSMKIIITAALTAGLFLGHAGHSSAFKGMGSGGTGAGAGNGAPHGGAASPGGGMKDIDVPSHAGNTSMVVANVNGREFTMGELMKSIADLIMRGGYGGGGNMTMEMSQRIRYDALEQLALEELAYQKGITLGLKADPAVVEVQVNAMMEQAGGEEAFAKSLAGQKKTPDEIRKEITRYLVVKQAIEQEVYGKVKVTDKEIDRTYVENKTQFTSPEKVTVSDIIFFLDPKDPSAQEKVAAIRQKIIDEYYSNPAEIPAEGFVVESQLNVSPENRPGLYEAAKKMQAGALSDPLVIDGTLHLVKFEFYQPARETPEKEAKASIAKQLKSNLRRQMLADWRKKLMAEADIKIMHDLLRVEEKK
ncbi:MAG: peptidyl-prolyl cis-trans isomerase [Deltaproteobacteria bacterium]|nr:peptidyl-prolyl cis-trans isomerase [Deltaproteobacteria bacterium]